MSYHPKTGLRYIASIRNGPAYGDAVACYQAAASRIPWLEIISHSELVMQLNDVCKDERAFVMIWGVRAPILPEWNKATFTVVYSEAGDVDPENMLTDHAKWLSELRGTDQVHGVFGHTPWMAELLSNGSGNGFVLPVGWDSSAMGEPDWSGSKTHRFSYMGAMAGKRTWALPAMKAIMGDDFHDATGSWRRGAIDVLNASRGYLYLSHSDVHSFSTFRIWQACRSSSAMIAEGGRDCWPMTEEMYVPIPTLTPDNVAEVSEIVLGLDDDVLDEKSRVLHTSMQEFHIDSIVEKYMVPASEQIVEMKK
jgi:hypothetical protein